MFIKFGDNMYQAEVLGKPFYNSDADEPDWEVETDNGFCDEASLYILSHNFDGGSGFGGVFALESVS